LCGAVG